MLCYTLLHNPQQVHLQCCLFMPDDARLNKNFLELMAITPPVQRSLLQRRSSVAVRNCHQMWFLNSCRCATADNSLSVAVLEPLLIIDINSGFILEQLLSL
jgi:hypothetical protein